MGDVYGVLHRLWRGHWPTWQKVDYDLLTFRWSCVVCDAIREWEATDARER